MAWSRAASRWILRPAALAAPPGSSGTLPCRGPSEPCVPLVTAHGSNKPLWAGGTFSLRAMIHAGDVFLC